MKKILSFLIRPNSPTVKWLSLALLVCMVILWSFGYLDKAINFLDSDALTFKFGKDSSFSALRIIKSAFIIVAMFWLTGMVSDYADRYIRSMKNIASSNRAIINKTFQIILYFIAFLILMDMLNIDLTTLAVFSGAVGIGVGFGLQKITSNFISGLILLFEKSARVDDLIELDGGIFGYIRYTGARYTLVEAVDGREIMIPNEDLITGRVTNWTYTTNKARVEIPVGVGYGSDIEKARELMLEAARENKRCMSDPEPQCYLRSFGDSSVDFLLLFWVENVVDGRYEPQSNVMRSIWKKFKEHNIEIPFPQRDVHIKNG